MNTHPTCASMNPYTPATFWVHGLFVAATLCLVGCRDSANSAENSPIDAPLEASHSEPTLLAPAQVSDAAAALDLSRLPLFSGAERPSEQVVTSLAYQVSGKPDAGFKFHQDQLVASGWKELPGSSITPDYASGLFAKRGLTLSLVTMPQQAGKVSVNLRHHGNINFGKLPVPNGAKSIYAGPSTAIFAVDLPVDTVARETASALKQAGWEPYGSAASVQWFKQNAVKLTVMSAVAPAQGGKTSINFSSEMLPVDVPVPSSATDVQFSNAQKRLTFRVALSTQECFAFYRESLAKKGWQSTMEAPIKIDADQILIFRTAAKDILRLGMREGRENQLQVFAEHMSAAEIEEMNRKLDAQTAAHKAAKAAAAQGQ